MHLSTLWRTALLSASRHLRQNVLKGRIWVDSSSPAGSHILAHADADGDGEGGESPYASDSFEDLDLGLVGNGNGNGGMKVYHSPTSSTSSLSLPPSPSHDDTDFASNTSTPNNNKGIGTGRRYKYRTVGRSQGRKGGKVRGMVQNWEKSGSESEGGGGEPEPESEKLSVGVSAPGMEKSLSNGSGVDEYVTAPSSAIDLDTAPVEEDPAKAETEEEEPSIEALLADKRRERHNSWGARAWEEFDADGSGQHGVTVKRIPGAGLEGRRVGGSVKRISGEGWEDEDGVEVKVDGIPSTMKHVPASETQALKPKAKKGSLRSKGSLRNRNGNGNGSDRRIVTAIFSADPDEPISSAAGDLITTPGEVSHIQKLFPLESAGSVPATPEDVQLQLGIGASAEMEKKIEEKIDKELEEELEEAAELARRRVEETRGEDVTVDVEQGVDGILELENEMLSSRALLEGFRKRLEEVERKVGEMEEEKQREVAAAAAKSRSLSPARSATPTPTRANTSSAIIKHALSYIYPSSMPPSASVSTRSRKRPDDPPVSALPSYVLLVSIGMCAIVLRVVMKRVGRGVKG